MRKLTIFIMILVGLAAILLFLRTPDTNPDQMREKYANAASRFISSEDGQLVVHYRDQGIRSGIPIILLHGTASSLHTWEPIVALLGDEYRIITLTLPGHGLTGPHPDDNYTFEGMAAAVDLVVEKLRLPNFVLGGNSMGGWVTWRYALKYPQRVDALLLLNAWGMPLRDGEAAPPSNLGFRLLQNPAGRILMEHYTPRSLVKKSALQSVAVKDVIDEKAADRYWELLRLPGNRRAAAIAAMTDRTLAASALVSEIDAPTLIIWGAEDQLIYASAAQTFDERMLNADVVIYEGVGHLPMEEAPQRTALDIDAFLERTVKSDHVGSL